MEGMLKTYSNSAILNIAQIEEICIKTKHNCLAVKMKNNFIEEHILYRDENRSEQFLRDLLAYLFQVLSQAKDVAFIDMREVERGFLIDTSVNSIQKSECINSTGRVRTVFKRFARLSISSFKSSERCSIYRYARSRTRIFNRYICKFYSKIRMHKLYRTRSNRLRWKWITKNKEDN